MRLFKSRKSLFSFGRRRSALGLFSLAALFSSKKTRSKAKTGAKKNAEKF